MALYGIYGEHTVAGCPLNNQDSRKIVINGRAVFHNSTMLSDKYKINKIIGQYHSALEHTFVWIVDAEDPHLLEQAAIESGLASFNSVKIVPMTTFDDVAAKCEQLENS
jgi:hypothetical protein